MIELLQERPKDIDLVTRRYPVELEGLRSNLAKDLKQPFDAVIHLGQAPGISSIKIEAVALNFAGCVEEQGEELPPIVTDGPVAYRSQMPVGRWAKLLREEKIPSFVSYHAGTFLCNATMYLTHHYFQDTSQVPKIGFLHLPLTTDQVAKMSNATPSLPVATMAQAVRHVLVDLNESFSGVSSASANVV